MTPRGSRARAEAARAAARRETEAFPHGNPDLTYVLHPGEIESPTDGGRHLITAAQLARCYGLRLRDCLVVREDSLEHDPRPLGACGPRAVNLFPRPRGDYERARQLAEADALAAIHRARLEFHAAARRRELWRRFWNGLGVAVFLVALYVLVPWLVRVVLS